MGLIAVKPVFVCTCTNERTSDFSTENANSFNSDEEVRVTTHTCRLFWLFTILNSASPYL